jgi:hypothetical protein
MTQTPLAGTSVVQTCILTGACLRRKRLGPRGRRNGAERDGGRVGLRLSRCRRHGNLVPLPARGLVMLSPERGIFIAFLLLARTSIRRQSGVSSARGRQKQSKRVRHVSSAFAAWLPVSGLAHPRAGGRRPWHGIVSYSTVAREDPELLQEGCCRWMNRIDRQKCLGYWLHVETST